MKTSKFKTADGAQWLVNWHQKVMDACQLDYESINTQTSYGTTHVWAKNHQEKNKPALLFLPGFRTCGIFWDLNNTLTPFYQDYRIYLVDVIGQPSLSAGKTPPVKGEGYGQWLVEVLDELGLDQVLVSGASFGGQLMVKLALAAPERVKAMVGFNPVGVQFISMGLRSMWYNLVTMIAPSPKNVQLYLDKMVLDPAFKLEKVPQQLLLEYQTYVVPNFKFGCDYPYKYSDAELSAVQVPAYFILCEHDRLIHQEKTAQRAKKVLPQFKSATFLSHIGHGIELAPQAFKVLKEIAQKEFQ